MQALRETTIWPNSATPNHVYLLDGNKLVAYIRQGTAEPQYFKSAIKGFSKTGRRFETVSMDLFDSAPATVARVQEVMGSKGDVYQVNLDENTCTCPGYTYRGTCKHTQLVATA